MTLKHGLAVGGGLLVRYPPEMVEKDKLTVNVDARDYGCPEQLTKPEVDSSARQILFVASGFSTELTVKAKGSNDKSSQGGPKRRLQAASQVAPKSQRRQTAAVKAQ